MAKKKDEWKCSFRGCKAKPEELWNFTGYGNNKNKDLQGEYCKEHFDKLYEDGVVIVKKETPT